MRAIILVNKRLDTDMWSQVDIGSPDMTAVEVSTGRGKVWIVNTYNDIGWQQGLLRSTLALQKRVHAGNPARHMEHTIWLGDFNLHHLLWDEECNGHLFMRGNLEKSQLLIDALAEFDLQMVLPKYVPTLQALATGNNTRPDNIFMSSPLAGRLVRCVMLPDERPARSDHIPVLMEVDLSLEEQDELPQPNFRMADWKGVREAMSGRLEGLDADGEASTIGKFFHWLDELTHMISEVIDECVPKTGLLPSEKWWWSPELSARCTALHRLT